MNDLHFKTSEFEYFMEFIITIDFIKEKNANQAHDFNNFIQTKAFLYKLFKLKGLFSVNIYSLI